MAYENIELPKPNFCFGPQADTICFVDTTNPNTVLRVKDTSGANILELSMSSNIVSDNVFIEYVGPRGRTAMVDGATFFTFERVNSYKCIIKRWQVRLSYLELLLKEEIVKQTSGYEYYDVTGFAVEYHTASFESPNEYYNYLDISSSVNIEYGTKLFLGPSSDADNDNATEYVTVHHAVSYHGTTRVYLNSTINNQYAIGDPITYYSYVYVYSSIGYSGDPSKGTLYKIDANSWVTKELDIKAFYKNVVSARWCPSVRAVASVVGTNLLFVSPYNHYLNWKSMFLNNVHQDTTSVFQVYDVIFDNYSIYKLQDKITIRFDDGNRNTEEWDTYNYQEDTLLPYTNSVSLSKTQSILTGYHKDVTIDVNVRDQFHVGLRDIQVEFDVDGDSEVLLDPTNGVVTTDLNGDASIDYRSGSAYTGHTEVSARASGSSNSTGSVYVWALTNILSYVTSNDVEKIIIQLKELTADSSQITQVTNYYTVITEDGGTLTRDYPALTIKGKSFFTTPGGDWGLYTPGGLFCFPGTIQQYLPMLYRGEDQLDGPIVKSFEVDSGSVPGFIGNQIKLLDTFDSDYTEFSVSDFDTEVNIVQPDESFSRLLSQLKLGHHTHWVDGEPYDYLWTYDTIDQFVFVHDAVPKFWSEKNPIASDIWIRIRPYAFSLNADTLRMWVREVSFEGDTGYVEVTDEVSIVGFDAGSVSGLEINYDRTIDFHYNAKVYVKIEIYDVSSEPNFVFVNYWFDVTPDYKAPYLLNLSPAREEEGVSVDNTIYFEIKDDGTGIDGDTLEIFLNSLRMFPEDLNIEIVNPYHFKVTYTPPKSLYFNKGYKVTVKVQDLTVNENMLNDSYRFYTMESEGVTFVDPLPGICKRGTNRFEDVSVVVLPSGNGVDKDSITLQVFNKDVNPQIVPILYRIS